MTDYKPTEQDGYRDLEVLRDAVQIDAGETFRAYALLVAGYYFWVNRGS
jgi:hypothetical protein